MYLCFAKNRKILIVILVVNQKMKTFKQFEMLTILLLALLAHISQQIHLSQYLWEQNSQLVKRIRNHPFITEMEHGTLALNKYKKYLEQDNLYLDAYSRAFAVASAKTTNNTHYNILIRLAGDALKEHNNLDTKKNLK
jgi:hypothetical protein